ncbi:uncharacterized protein MEPE_01749 [Melanopsichium pennsylvanicum]|uniref:Uncharacterized protein n=2 Tax=Melanopsichium pennsylvanicum TaxID=63383 RepID=A0AAJ4XJ22_9BASI|nr:conserved hypothetical protein [Melanopsichium pennsylvanicum 4]SNX83043.1 uncharacterized protein MEPE_01749 [Melanopsichium pennsylvanicum]
MASESSPTSPEAAQAKYGQSWSLPGSAQRNAPAIAEALAPLLSLVPSASSPLRTPVILEVASGFGHQIHAIASKYTHYQFQPSEADAYPRIQIDANNDELTNVSRAEALDLLDQNDWLTLVHNVSGETVGDVKGCEDEGLFAGVIACNLTHVAPWKVTESLFSHLDPRVGYVTQQGYCNLVDRKRGWIAIYGAFNENASFTSEANRKFDKAIRSRNSEFGLRDVQSELLPLAYRHGYELTDRIEMPAGNLLLIFKVRNE